MHYPTVLDKFLLTLVLLGSISGFLHRLLPILGRIRRAKPDPGFKLTPLGPRLAELFSQVGLQSKVIAQRPLAGAAHAFVFWGFCAFALVSVNHVLTGFNLPLFSYLDGAGVYYGWFAALFAITVAVSIAGLFVRRFLIRPRWLGEVSPESGIVAGLIFLLMITYLIQFFSGFFSFLGGDSTELWWIHTLALAVFLPLIPHTKHLHLILSPFSVFFSRGSFAAIPKLDGDEDFGLDTGKDLTQIVALQTYSCVECGRCSEHCPATNTGKLLDPKQIALGVRGYLNEFGPHSEEPLLGKHLFQEAAFQCTTCGACEFQCPVGVEHVPIIVGLRRGAVNTGKWEDTYGTKLFLALERNGNALGFSHSERDKFVAREQFPVFDGSQEYCLWLGCMGSYDPRGREIVAAFARVMQHLGTSFGVLAKEKCTGDPARRLGNDLAFGQLAEEGLAAFESGNVKKIVSICPHCVRTIQTDWKEYGQAPPIEHHSEFLARYASQLPAGSGEPIAFHDPCYLGRYQNKYDQPRQALARFGKVVDPPRSRERGFCCGAGGGMTFLGEEKGERISHNRARELAGIPAATVAAACPFCNSMLSDALKAISQAPPKLLDIAEIAAAHLASPETTKPVS